MLATARSCSTGGSPVMGFVVRTIVIAIAVAVVAYFYPSISYGEDITTLIAVAVVLGLLNAFVKPILKIFTLPLNMMTFGLFGVVINAVLLLAVAALGDLLGGQIAGLEFEFVVGGFPPEFGLDAIIAAVVGAIGISIVGTIVGMVVPD
jgi:putative membrane protein